jgi:hypothetical protein
VLGRFNLVGLKKEHCAASIIDEGVGCAPPGQPQDANCLGVSKNAVRLQDLLNGTEPLLSHEPQ